MIALKKYPKAKLTFSYPALITEEGIKVTEILKSYKETVFFKPKDFEELLKFSLNYLHINTVVFEKKAFIESGSFVNENLFGNYDMVVYHAMALRHGIIFIPDAIAFLRIHNRNFSNVKLSERKLIAQNYLKVLNSADYVDVRNSFANSGILVAIYNYSFSLLLNREYIKFLTLPFFYWYFSFNIKNFGRRIVSILLGNKKDISGIFKFFR